MTTEVKTASIENFKKLCELAGLTDEQMNYCRSITVSSEKFGWLEVEVEYSVPSEDKK